MAFLLRTVPSALSSDGAADYDRLLEATMRRLLGGMPATRDVPRAPTAGQDASAYLWNRPQLSAHYKSSFLPVRAHTLCQTRRVDDANLQG